MDIKAAVLKVPTPDFGERFHLPASCPIQARRADEEQLIYLDEAVVLAQKFSQLVRFTQKFCSFDTNVRSGSPGIRQTIPREIYGQCDMGPDITTRPCNGRFDGMTIRGRSEKHKVSKLNEYERWQCETASKTFERNQPSFDKTLLPVTMKRYFP